MGDKETTDKCFDEAKSIVKLRAIVNRSSPNSIAVATLLYKPSVAKGFFQREIARSASDYQNKVDEGKRIVVGVNKFVKDNEKIDIPILEIGSEAEQDQLKKLSDLKKHRNNILLEQ